MKIGISGAHGVGKTTILDTLRGNSLFKGYKFQDEITRKLARQGFKINKDGDDTTQLAIMKEHVCNLALYPNMVTDRTVLDGFVYTSYLQTHDKISDDTFRYAAFVFNQMVQEYDILFYIKPEFDLVGDELRSDDIQFQYDIADLFERTIKYHDLGVIYLSGSLDSRIKTVKEFMSW